MSESRFWAIVPAAGKGRRMGEPTPKQYLPLAGKLVIEHTLDALLAWPDMIGLALALSEDDEHFGELNYSRDERVFTCVGGESRAESVLAGLRSLAAKADDADWVLVHDAARPCLAVSDLKSLVENLKDHEVGGLLALPVSETVKKANAEAEVVATISRDGLWLAQTPQMFRYGVLLRALETALEKGITVTDEASAIEAAGLRPKLIESSPVNIKITRPQDLIMAAYWLRARGEGF